VSSLVRRPTARGLVKTTGGLVAAVGVLSAFAAPASPVRVFDLAAARTAPVTTTVRAPETAALAARPTYGVIGFKAVARQTPKPPKATPSERTEEAASRGIRRSGLRGELGLTQNALVVLNAVRDNFPAVTSFGGYRAGDMDHGTGTAVDCMVSSRATGDAVAAYVIEHARQLNVKYVIWYQRIWMPQTGTWRTMEDRGGVTANHMDHVHVSVN
jgi:hypothetical protein